MDRTTQQWNIPEGTDVYGSEGDKVGKVIAVYSNYYVVEKGFFFPTDYYIPANAFASFDGDRAHLNMTKDQALNSGWDVAPADTDAAAYDASGTATYADFREEMPSDMSAAAAADASAGAAAAAFGTTGHMGESATSPGLAGDLTDERAAVTDDVLRVPVYEEELTATKRPVEEGRVRVEKDVVTEERVMDVPVTEERVRVERRPVDRAAAPGEAAFREETLEVPLRAEEVEAQKRVREAEEVDIAKERVQRTERVAGEVRREEVRVEDQTIGAESNRDASNPL